MSEFDGKIVRFASDPIFRGMVLGDAALPGRVRVKWLSPEQFVGIHLVADLDVQNLTERRVIG